MKTFKKIGRIVLCMVALAGFMGCSDDEDNAPSNISGMWSCVFTRPGLSTLVESWTFVQSGESVTGSYTYNSNVWNFTGTYVDGRFTGVDADGWVLNLTFDGNIAEGTISGNGSVENASLTKM